MSETLEYRKIMALGASLVVTLPKPWTRSNRLNKGDKVSMKVQRDQTLLVTPGLVVHEPRRELNLFVDTGESENSLIRNIVAGFLDGYTSIKLTSSNFFSIGQQRAIREVSGGLYMMIVESKLSLITLEILLDESKTSIETSVERMHLVTYSMCGDILNSLQDPNIDRLKAVISLEDDVDHLTFLVLRLIRLAAMRPSLASQFGLSSIDCLDLQTIVHRIERIADHVTIIADSLIDLIERDIRIPEEIMSVLVEAAGVAFSSYDQSVMSFLLRDVTNVNEIINEEKEIEDLCMKITPIPYSGGLNDVTSISHIILIRESIKKVSHYAADIAELTINRTYNIY